MTRHDASSSARAWVGLRIRIRVSLRRPSSTVVDTLWERRERRMSRCAGRAVPGATNVGRLLALRLGLRLFDVVLLVGSAYLHLLRIEPVTFGQHVELHARDR